ncbi:S8 family peptidase [Chryseobacterium polytrichastri]|uniref:Por secretion system C-terminal sorting domain-containing protein n=1 Tax=Chryseobacterium polytrichastri TaxID=1302687 RepID=A0A1M7C956_9FLAO|nr:S8 family peptidase [Chryseobacterium polytrichastri]SHL63399.1 Por secretion system C-terminal sorting domain-containing protein [Chryseobacterium polytrichastri]
MKKHLLLVGTLAITLLSAQNNEGLKREFERQNRENTAKFDSYVSKHYGADKSPEALKEIEEQRSNLAGFAPNGLPYFYKGEDLDQVKNSNADFLQNGTVSGLTGSFNGENIKYTIFDGGRAFAGHILFNNLPNRVTNYESSSMNYSAHATGVTGFIGSKNYPYTFQLQGGGTLPVNFKGVASNSTFDNYAFATTTLPGNTTTSTVFDKILLAQPKISNHSYGSNAGWSDASISGAWLWTGNYSTGISLDLQGTYFTNDQNYDQIVYNNPSYVIVKSAGNYFGMGPTGNTTPAYYRNSAGTPVLFAATDIVPPNNCSLGYDCIGPGSLAKNIIVVGATDIITTNDKRYTASTDVVRSDYSSAGPRDDGGIKPDISTTGTNVANASTPEDTIGGSQVSIGSGTSFSAPIVTGIIGLWMQVYKQLFPTLELNAAAAKTLMIHSASEAGNVGPDAWFGWGYINAQKGAELLVGKSNNTVIFNNETLTSGTPNIKRVKASASEPLKVTISWIDPEYVVPANLTYQDAYNNRISRLVNDLDLRIIDTVTGTIYQPWKLNALSPMTPATKGDNTVDNVEQVIVDTPTSGREYRIEIGNKGTLKNNAGVNAPQNYSIIVTGYSQEVLATGETTKNNGIAIAPTITKDIVNVLKAPVKSTFTIYDLSGKRLNNGVINSDKEAIDISSYTKGIYIIEVKTDKEVISKKVIKE